jgi:CRISPR-associated endonuclease Csn1
MKVLGLDCGIASIGWAVLEYDKLEIKGSIVAAGTRMFDSPEEATQSGPKLKSEMRRTFRGQRRIIRRRKQRMNAVRRLLQEHGLLTDAKQDALKFQGTSPWDVRGKANEKLLNAHELAVALGHIARHRGFKSNAKSQGENDVEGSKMKKAMAQTMDKLMGRTFGQMLATDPEFIGRKRNREGDYSRTPLRAELEAEVRSIFRAQQRMQNKLATPALEAAFVETAFFQRGLQDSEKLLAECAFETKEKRTSKRAYSFELFRFLSRLNTFEILEGRVSRRVTTDELSLATRNFGSTKKITFKALRKLWKLPDTASFSNVRTDDEKLDVTSRSGNSAEGTGTLFNLFEGAAWDSLVKTPEKLDRIAEIISFREDLARIKSGLEEIGLEPLVLEKLMGEVQTNTFNQFTGAGHVSSLACRNMLPHLARGLVYSDAASACHYDHTANRERNAFDVGVTGKQALAKILSGEIIDRQLVGSPVARKALIEAVKQVKAIIEVHGVPDAIHIELARDVGKGIDERRKIEKGIEDRNKQKDKMRLEFAEIVGQPCSSVDELTRYELWKQQNGKCVYSDELVSPRQLIASDNSVQVDHILPWSRFGDDSFHNKTLCTTRANQEKRGQTPFEWFSKQKSEAEWDAFVARVQSLPALKGFKRCNYTIKDAASVQDKFRSRNLNDTRWTCRLLAECLRQLYPKGQSERKVFTRPGALTDRMRRGWGVQWIKKDEKGERIPDDRHHALDAIITAATTEGMMQKLTEAFKKQEALGSPRDFSALDQPWVTFRQEAIAAVESVFVSRAERHRARGEAHAATIRSISEVDGLPRVFERKRVADLKITDLDKIKGADRNAALITSLRNWIEEGNPADKPPLSPKGDPIAKVTLLSKYKLDVIVRGGAVERGEMARVDVFRKKSAAGTWQHYVIPIYPHHIAREVLPPNRAVQANTPEDKWPKIDDTYEFMWSLTPMNYLEIETANGENLEGYYRGASRSTGAFEISNNRNSNDKKSGIGARTLKTLNKYSIDRLGQRHLVKSELRTWRGKVCISASPQG